MLSSFFCLPGLAQMGGLVEQPATMRMPIDVEARLLKAFDHYKRHFALQSALFDMTNEGAAEGSGA
jgi:hypothetical protein